MFIPRAFRLLLSLSCGAGLAATVAATAAPAAFAAPMVADVAVAQALAPFVNGDSRTHANRARDIYRHPADTLAFFGVKPGSHVVEINPAGGWYTEILAPYLKSNGLYVAAVPRPASDTDAGFNAFKSKLAADPLHYGAAKIDVYDTQNPAFGKPGSADVVLTFRNLHNWVDSGNQQRYLKAAFLALKPGGIFGIVDHRAATGTALVLHTGYLPVDTVIKMATDAGFHYDGASEINANPRDTKDYPKGVWTLPPSYALGQQDRARYAAIGESDRFTLRFVKPSM